MKKNNSIEELKSEGLVANGNGVRSNFRMEMPKDSYFTQEKPIMEFLKDKIKNKNTIEDLVEEGKVTTADKVEPKKFKESDVIILNMKHEEPEDWKTEFWKEVELKLDEYQKLQLHIQIIQKKQKWIKQIEDYCSSVGILPEDLIKTHREANKGLKSKTKTLQQGIKEIEAIKPIGGKKDHSNWNENYRNKKLGL